MVEFSLWDIISHLLLATRWTLALSAIALAGGGIVGALLLLARLRGGAPLQWLVVAWVQLFQGTPLLMQLFLAYFGAGLLLGIEISPWTAAAVALTAHASAFLTDIWRGCMQAVPRGQWEASASLAMSWGEQLRHVVLPQARRLAVAPTVGFCVQLIKATALASVIGFVEVTKTASLISNASLRPLAVFGCAALLYFVICYPVSLCARSIERKLRVRSA